MSHPTCQTCYFWRPLGSHIDGDHGHCLRFPPQWIMDEPNEGWAFPEVTSMDVCGEHKHAKKDFGDNPNRVRLVGFK